MRINHKQEQTYTPTTIQSGEFSGSAVSISENGNWAVVSRIFNGFDENESNFVLNAGAAQILEKQIDGTYKEKQKIAMPSGQRFPDNHFGSSVLICPYGDKMFIAAHEYSGSFTDGGAVAVFELNGDGVWEYKQTIEPTLPNSHINSKFGWFISCDYYGKRLVTGAPFFSDTGQGLTNVGAGFLFEEQQGAFVQLNHFKLSSELNNNYLGYSGVISGDGEIIFIGAELSDQSGSINVYKKLASGTFPQTQSQILRDTQPKASEHFGSAVNDFNLFTGSPMACDHYGRNLYAANINKQYPNFAGSSIGGVWWISGDKEYNYKLRELISAKDLKNDDKNLNQFFGHSVSTDRYGRYLLIGAQGDSDIETSSGAIYLYKRTDNFNEYSKKIKLISPLADDFFGYSSQIQYDGKGAIVGASDSNLVVSDGGASYFYSFDDESVNHELTPELILAHQLKNKKLISSLFKVISNEMQDIEEMLLDLKYRRWVDNAEGKQLDGLGDIVGVSRNGLTDDEYRLQISTQISINVSGGQPEILISIYSALTNSTEIQYQEFYPAHAYLFSDGPDMPLNISTILNRLRPAGVSMQIVSAKSNTPFVFDGDNDGLGLSSDGTLAGGIFSESYE